MSLLLLNCLNSIEFSWHSFRRVESHNYIVYEFTFTFLFLDFYGSALCLEWGSKVKWNDENVQMKSGQRNNVHPIFRDLYFICPCFIVSQFHTKRLTNILKKNILKLLFVFISIQGHICMLEEAYVSLVDK